VARRDRDRNRIRIATELDFRNHVVRALQVDSVAAGGYLVVGKVYRQRLRQEGKLSAMRNLSRVLEPLSGREESVGIPSQESALSDAAWTSELANESADSAAPFGKRELKPHPLMKRIRVSKKLLRSEPNAERWILDAIADAIATPEEAAFLQGSGSGEPQGIIGHDDVTVMTTADAGVITLDEVKQWIFSLPARFARQAQIVARPSFVGYLLQLKDGDGDYLIPDFSGKLFNIPVHYSDGMPEAIDTTTWAPTAGEVAAIIGDFRTGYWIVDSDELDLVRLAELYAEDNETGIQATQYTDGAPVVPDAFSVLQVKSS